MTESIVDELVVSFPEFRRRWLVIRGDEDERLAYIEISEFAMFVVEDLYEQRDGAGTQRAFDKIDQMFQAGDDEVKTLITIGFLEGFQNNVIAKYDLSLFTQFLSPHLLQEWNALIKFWNSVDKSMPIEGHQ